MKWAIPHNECFYFCARVRLVLLLVNDSKVGGDGQLPKSFRHRDEMKQMEAKQELAELMPYVSSGLVNKKAVNGYI